MKGEGLVGQPGRLIFIDYIRVSLAVLVVLHHVAVVYGGAVPFYYVEPPGRDTLAFRALLLFVLVNQSWFMGAFFLLAGYFTPGSLDRKGTGAYLKERLLRLGIPLLVFIFVLNPICFIGLYRMPSGSTGTSTSMTWKAYPHLLGMGPMWFAAMLLLFTLAYIAWRLLNANRVSSALHQYVPPHYLGIGLFILILAGAGYLTRMFVPIGMELLGFPTLSYFPQYLTFFVMGILAFRYNWFLTLPRSVGLAGLVTAIVAGIVLFPLAVSGKLFSLRVTPALTNALGHGHWQSAVYALWDSMFAVGISLGMIPIFRDAFTVQAGSAARLGQLTYAVYVIHIPILVMIALTLSGIALPSLMKFGVVAVVAIPLCFAAAYVLRRIPWVSRVL